VWPESRRPVQSKQRHNVSESSPLAGLTPERCEVIEVKRRQPSFVQPLGTILSSRQDRESTVLGHVWRPETLQLPRLKGIASLFVCRSWGLKGLLDIRQLMLLFADKSLSLMQIHSWDVCLDRVILLTAAGFHWSGGRDIN
jgi:hypothetical protein